MGTVGVRFEIEELYNYQINCIIIRLVVVTHTLTGDIA